MHRINKLLPLRAIIGSCLYKIVKLKNLTMKKKLLHYQHNQIKKSLYLKIFIKKLINIIWIISKRM